MSDARRPGPLRMTISDPETGEVLEDRVIRDDYAVVTAGRRYVKSIQVFGRNADRATHMVAIAWDKEAS